MNFELSDERKMLQETLNRFLNDHYSNAVIEGLKESELGFSPDIWNGLADLGILGALVSPEHGGFGGEGFDIALVFEELGRVGAVDPILDSVVLAGGLLAALGNADQKAMLEPLMTGQSQWAFAHSEPSSRYELNRVQTTAALVGNDYVITGHKAMVVNADSADFVIVSARTSGDTADENGISLFVLPKALITHHLQSYPIGTGGRACELYLDKLSVPAHMLLGDVDQAYHSIEHVNASATVAICAEAVGLMDAIKHLTVDYLKVRKQFGQPIGKFQVLQHRMADVLIEIEQAKSAVVNLAGHLDADRLEREIQVSATKNLIGLVGKLVVEESVQMHGGIGVTMEYELGHLVRRLTLIDHRFGDSTHHLERYIELAVA